MKEEVTLFPMHLKGWGMGGGEGAETLGKKYSCLRREEGGLWGGDCGSLTALLQLNNIEAITIFQSFS